MGKTKLINLIATFTAVLHMAGACGQAYEPPRTANGKPNLQGTWSNASITTLERNPRYENLVLTADEIVRATDEHPPIGDICDLEKTLNFGSHKQMFRPEQIQLQI